MIPLMWQSMKTIQLQLLIMDVEFLLELTRKQVFRLLKLYLKHRFREIAFLTKGLKIVARDKREEEEKEVTFHYEGGIKEFVQYLNKSNTALYDDILYFEGNKDGVMVEVAMQHNDAYTENTYGFVNNITTPEGGTHIVGFRNALTKTFNEYARKNKLLKESEQNLTGEDIREG